MKVQSTSQQLEKEILVVEYMIEQMVQCLEIYYDAKMHDEFKVTLEDIEKCKRELNRLIARRPKTETNFEQMKFNL